MLDNIKAQEQERSLFIIKPDSYMYKTEILKELRQHFELQYVRDVILNEEFLAQLYDDEADENINLMNVVYFKGKIATIGIAQGENCQKRLFELCGDSYDPNMCHKTTIRYKYSTKKTPIIVNGGTFYLNAIHRSLPEEAEKEIELYMKTYIRNRQERMEKDER